MIPVAANSPSSGWRNAADVRTCACDVDIETGAFSGYQSRSASGGYRILLCGTKVPEAGGRTMKAITDGPTIIVDVEWVDDYGIYWLIS